MENKLQKLQQLRLTRRNYKENHVHSFQTSATGDVPPNTPTVWFSVTLEIELSPNTSWTKGSMDVM